MSLRSTDGGATWTPIAGVDSGIIRFSSASIGVIAQTGFNQFFRTTDGGATWTSVSYGAGVNFVGALDFESATNGRALFDSPTGRRYGSTTDGGATWVLSSNAPSVLPATFGKVSIGAARWIIVGEIGAIFVVTFQ
jgi:photosystem II stability/assembly factor-like uncharacterized protein